MSRLGCTCDRFRPGRPYERGVDCGHCWAYWHDPRVNFARGGGGAVVPVGAAVDVADLPRVAAVGAASAGCSGCRQLSEPVVVSDPAPRADDPPAVIVPGLDWPRLAEDVRDAGVQARYLAAFRDVLKNPPPYPGHDDGEGDVIVYLGGGRFWPGVAIGCRIIRELGCKTPIQVWYRGESERVRPADVRGAGVELVDLDAMQRRLGDARVPRGRVDVGGWEGKHYAITHTRYRRVLFLDADAYPCSSPCKLFGALDRGPFALWGDLENTLGNVQWAAVWPDLAGADIAVPPVQGGQFLIDRERAWPLLYATHWMNQHSDFYYRHMFGDQDTWRTAIAATGFPFVHLGESRWVYPAFVLDYGGKPTLVHRCKSKLFPGTRPRRNDALPIESRVFRLFQEYGDAP